MGLFGKKNEDGFGTFVDPDGKMQVAMKSGNMTFANGETYFGIGDNMATDTKGNLYFKTGDMVFGSDGSSHMKFGDNPTFFV